MILSMRSRHTCTDPISPDPKTQSSEIIICGNSAYLREEGFGVGFQKKEKPFKAHPTTFVAIALGRIEDIRCDQIHFSSFVLRLNLKALKLLFSLPLHCILFPGGSHGPTIGQWGAARAPRVLSSWGRQKVCEEASSK